MSVVSPLSDSALQQEPEASDDTHELPTQPWHAPPALLDALSVLGPEFEAGDFDLR